MNVAVIGGGDINDTLAQRLENEGFTPVILADVDGIDAISGQIGSFDIKTGGKNIKACCIIVTERKAALPDGIYQENPGASCIPLLSAVREDIPGGIKGKIVFLMDHPDESPGFMTAVALEKALGLAGRKRKVVYLSRFMRTAGEGLEDLYARARENGVTFLKYEDVRIGYHSGENLFRLKASDRYGEVEIDAEVLIAADRVIPGEAGERAARLLRLKTDNEGFIKGDAYFLYPVLTNRKGVYSLSLSKNEAAGKGLDEAVDYIIKDIGKGLAMLGTGEHAEVDNGKCAFCYSCYRACPHAAMTPDFENSAMKNLEDACFACGICVSICPAQAVGIVPAGDTDRKGIGVKAAPNALKVFCCENSAEIALKNITGRPEGAFDDISISGVSCGGDITAEKIIGALKEYGKVLVAVCVDEACKHFEGNVRARLQVERAREMLASAGMDTGRVEFLQVSCAMPEAIGRYLDAGRL